MRMSSILMFKVPLCAWLMCLAVPTLASAQDAQPEVSQFYVAPMLGPHIKLKSWDLHKLADQGQTDAPLWPQLGVRAGVSMLTYAFLDAELSYLTYSPAQGARNHALSYRLGAGAELFPARRTSPLFTAGFGAYHNVAGSHGIDLDMRTDYGFGVRHDLSTSWRARVDARHVFTDGVGDFELGHNLEVLCSLEFTAWRAIKDSDGDEVPDLQDQCVTQPGPATTSGCPDTDLDGVMDARDRCVELAGAQDQQGCPDSDADGLLDPDDVCPLEAGPLNQGGCSSLDVDRDGIPDDVDVCANVPEDMDGHEDEDGCPDLDNDGDSISDDDDKCPMSAETFNGVDDRDGCPETDQDGDDIMDGRDRCPMVIETLNEFEDFDGCPDTVPEDVLAMDGELPGISFSGGDVPALTPSSLTQIDRLVNLMKTHPSIRYTITVYTGSEGNVQDSYFASERQARALRKYLLEQGVKSEHVQAVGGGASEGQPQVVLERF